MGIQHKRPHLFTDSSGGGRSTTVGAPPSTFGQGRTFGLAMIQSGGTELLAAVIADPPEKLASMLRGVVLSS